MIKTGRPEIMIKPMNITSRIAAAALAAVMVHGKSYGSIAVTVP